MFVKSHGSAVLGIDALPIAAEVNITAGIGMYLVGLPDNAVRESQERIRAAFENCSYKMSGKKVVVNLSPADIRKEGSAYDLTIALGILAATEQLPAERLSRYIVMGELSLDGSVLPVRGALPMALAARDKGFAGVILPRQNAPEAAVVSSIDVYGISHLREVVDFLRGDRELEPVQADTQALLRQQDEAYEADFSDVKGQRVAKRALEIAAAGGHNVLMIGSPGSGKTMLARRLPSIMPPMTLDEALETTKIHSVAGRIGAGSGLIGQRPFRSPHHLTSRVALIGGGSTPQPGEISLAHNGVLFLDELPEFGRTLIETLRQPMEEGRVTVSRAKYTVEYPADFMLIAAMNPCPCGYYGHPSRECVCSQNAVYQYMNRISGPVLDRIDLHVHVSPLSFSELYGERPEESSATIRLRVVAARAAQQARFAGLPIHCNASMGSKQIRAFCPLPAESETMLRRAMERMHLSARAYDRIVKVARTIADLAGEAQIAPAHIAEAIHYRSLDRESAR
ncbi:YifB family Mg chelatase-like AAA ATPase [uncultured Alistipes sp.]|uniref:YifB family Mg chelatase-like AAA ATPase n=1 Tax=uncultured Alistipes sp. TaxID=538949 RepID=UPI0025919B82|nr:YifB family Mg chelatase-like AAA ATPase [uncultured Alistipes sp.]